MKTPHLFSLSILLFLLSVTHHLRAQAKGDMLEGTMAHVDEEGGQRINGISYNVAAGIVGVDFQVIYTGTTPAHFRYAFMRKSDHALLTPFLFESYNYIKESALCLVRINEHFGLMDLQGKLKVMCMYDGMNPIHTGSRMSYIVVRHNKGGLIDSTGKVLIPLQYDLIKPIDCDIEGRLAIVKKDNLYGLMNLATRQLVVPMEYSSLIYDAKQLLAKKMNLYNWLDCSGKPASQQWYNDIRLYKGNWYRVSLGDKNGILEAPGKPVLPIIYDLIEPSYTGVLLLKTNGQFGLMAPDLHWIVPLGQYDSLASATENLLLSFKGGHQGLIRSDGTEVLAAVNDRLSFEMTSINEKAGNSGRNYTVVKTGKTYGLMSLDGGMILPATYELLTQELGIPSRCLIAVQNGKYGLWQAAQDVASSLPSNLLIPFKYEELSGLNDQLIIAKEKGKYGVIRISNQEIVLPFAYSSVEYAHGGLVAYDGTYHLYTVDKDRLTPLD